MLQHHMEVCLDTVTTADDAGSSRKIKIRDPSFHLLSRAVMITLQLFFLFLLQQGSIRKMTTANYFGDTNSICTTFEGLYTMTMMSPGI